MLNSCPKEEVGEIEVKRLRKKKEKVEESRSLNNRLLAVFVSQASSYECLIEFFFTQNICCGYSKELSHWDSSFEHPQHMLKLMGKQILTISCSNLDSNVEVKEIEVKRLGRKKEKVEESRSLKNVFVVHCDMDIMLLLNSIILRVLEQKCLCMFLQ